MSSNPLRLKQLLRKYLLHEISREELEEFWKLMSELDEEDLVREELSELWIHTNDQEIKNLDWTKLDARLQQKVTESSINLEKILNPLKRVTRYWVAAASLLVVCAIAVFFSSKFRQKGSHQMVLSTRSNFDLQVIQLSDGTSVTLNHNSRLDYPPAFDGNMRQVYLTGEAYFDVKHDPSKPFIVHSENLIVKVLGTAFNIRSYKQDSQVAVTVSRGKVQVQKSNEVVLGMLGAGDQLLVKKSGEDALKVKVDIEHILQWKKRELVFENVTIDEAALTIGNYYGKKIRFIKDDVRNCRFTARFSGEEEQLEEVLEVITTLTGTTWIVDSSDVISIDGKGCE
jgi:ferric-dicitrate binding protein FerR (iron transport regulator)